MMAPLNPMNVWVEIPVKDREKPPQRIKCRCPQLPTRGTEVIFDGETYFVDDIIYTLDKEELLPLVILDLDAKGIGGVI